MYECFFKRFFDVLISAFILLLLFPIFVFICILIIIDSGNPVFFIQKRFGKNAHVFRIYKFRTMTNKKREFNLGYEVLKNDPEVTNIGRFLRRFKIDELPQLFCVFCGDMSIVGPRPGMLEQLTKLDENGLKRLDVLPGLTGLAQVNGNIYLEWKDRWKYDKYYTENISFLLDLKIVVKTVKILFFGEDKFIKKP